MRLIWLLFAVCYYLLLLGFTRLKFLCVCKCIWRSQVHSQKVFEVISIFLWIAKVHGQWAIRRKHRSPSTLLTIKPRMTLKYWTSNPLSSFKCRPFHVFDSPQVILIAAMTATAAFAAAGNLGAIQMSMYLRVFVPVVFSRWAIFLDIQISS
jgi:hypothetical protein